MTLDAFETNGSSPPETIAGYRIHPAANLFPLMTEPELQALADDIKANGQREPVILIGASARDSRSEDKIIDGRNRALACGLLGIEPEFTYHDTADPVAFVLSKNLHRRHLTASQRAMVALEVEKLYSEQAKPGTRTDLEEPRATNSPRSDGRAAVKAADAMDVSPAYVKKAKALAKADPAKAADVKAGKVSLSAATAKSKKPSAEDIAARALAEERWANERAVDAAIYQDIRDVMNTGGDADDASRLKGKEVTATRDAYYAALFNFQGFRSDDAKPANAETWHTLVEAARLYREAIAAARRPEPPKPKGKRKAKAEPEPTACAIPPTPTLNGVVTISASQRGKRGRVTYTASWNDDGSEWSLGDGSGWSQSGYGTLEEAMQFCPCSFDPDTIKHTIIPGVTVWRSIPRDMCGQAGSYRVLDGVVVPGSETAPNLYPCGDDDDEPEAAS